MQKKKWRKLSIAAASVMAFAVICAGCGNKEDAGKTSEATRTVESVESQASSESQTSEEPVEITLMADWGNKTELDNQWFAKVEKELNIKFNFIEPASSAYEEALQKMIVSGEYPDAVLLPTNWLTGDSFRECCEQGTFLDLSDLLKNYKNITDHTADISWKAMDIFQDGRTWGIPRSTMIRCDGFSFKQAWLEKLNINYKEGTYLTADEFFDILYAFTYNDPDGNGLDDTYGISTYMNDNTGALSWGLNYIFGIGDTDAWGDYDGEIIALKYSQTKSNFKDYLTFANKCWEAGIIDPDAFSLNAGTAGDRNDQYGASVKFPGYLEVTDKAGLEVFVPGVVVKEGDSYGFPNFNTGVWCYWAISSSCEHPEKVMEFFDYVLSDAGWRDVGVKGLEGVTFTVDANGNYDASLGTNEDGSYKEGMNPNAIIKTLRRSDGADFFVSIRYNAETRKRLIDMIDICIDNAQPALDNGYVPEIASDSVFIEYNNYMTDQINKIIVGDVPVDEWDNILQGWYDAGGTKYVEEMRAYIASLN